MGIAAGVAFGYFVQRNLTAGIGHIHELELALAATNAVLLSTKGISGQTTASIVTLSQKYEGLNATIDKKVIQSAENLLLTFTLIPKKAFEPTLQAALNLNQALGGGAEGLQGNLIKVAKAVNDPVVGLTTLGRVGVQFTVAEKEKIKALVASNHLYAAQQIVIDKLTTKFGGAFAAAGNTAAGRVALLHARVRDLQVTFAGPFSSALDLIVTKFDSFLGEAGTQRAVQNLGESIAGIFSNSNLEYGIGLLRRGLDLFSQQNLQKAGRGLKDAFDFVKNIDWSTIERVLKVTGAVAKTAVDAFMSLPPNIQAAVIAGLAVNKLSGGLAASGIGNIAGGLIKIAFSQFGNRGSTPLNPVFVSGVGGIGGPGGGVPPVGGAPLIATVAAAGVVIAGTLLSQGSNANQDIQVKAISAAAHEAGATIKDVLNTGATLGAIAQFAKDPTLRIGVDPALLTAIDALASQINGGPTPTRPIGGTNSASHHRGSQRGKVDLQDPWLKGLIGAGILPSTAMPLPGVKDTSSALPTLAHIGESSRLTADRLESITSALQREGGTLSSIDHKNWSPTITVNNVVNARLSVTQALNTIAITHSIRYDGKQVPI